MAKACQAVRFWGPGAVDSKFLINFDLHAPSASGVVRRIQPQSSRPGRPKPYRTGALGAVRVPMPSRASLAVGVGGGGGDAVYLRGA